MKKQILYFSLFLLALLIYACKKAHIFDNTKTDGIATKFSVSNAKAYLDSTLKTNSASIKLSSLDTSSGTETFNGYLFWDKAQSFLNKNFEVVEVPTALDYRKVNFYKLGGDASNYITDKAVAEAAFTRVLIFRDSTQKIISKRIITYIPDKSYLSKNPNPSSNNWINNIDKDYSGYIEYRTWENVPYLVLRLTGGKVKANYNLTRQNNSTSLKTQGLKTSSWECDLITVPIIRTAWMNGVIIFKGEIGTETYLSCSEVPDGYSPEPTFNGNGNGNGGTPATNPPTEQIGDAEINGPHDPDFPSNCASWQYKSVANGDYQACGVTDLRFDYITEFQNAQGNLEIDYFLGTFTKTVYLEFPRVRADGTFITAGEAANLTALAKDDAENILESQVESSPPPSSNAEVQIMLNRFLDILKSKIQYYGGRVTFYNNYGTSSVTPYSKGIGGC